MNDDLFIPEFIGDNSSLPSRSTIHRAQGIEESGKNKIIKIFFSSFVFVIIIAIVLVFIFSDNFKSNINNKYLEDDGTNSTQSVDVDNQIDKELDQTGIITDINPNEIEQSWSVDVVVDEERSESALDVSHIVKAGENLYNISLQYYGHGYMERLAEYNNIKNSEYITVGTILEIPNKEVLK